MMRLIGFELNKMLKSKKNIIILILMILGFTYSSWATIKMCGETPVNAYIGENSMFINFEIKQRHEYPILKDESKVKNCEKGLELLWACENKDHLSEEYLNWNLDYLTNQDSVGRERIDKLYEIAVTRYLLKNNVLPEQFLSAPNGLFLLQTMSACIPYFLPFIIALIVGDMFNKEYKNGSHKLLLTQPYKKSKVVLAKWVASVTYCVAAAVASVVPMVLFTGIKNGFGSMDYPMRISENFLSLSLFSKTIEVNFLPANLYFTLFFILIFLLICAVCAVAVFCSCILKNKGLTLSALAIAAMIPEVLFSVFFIIPHKIWSLYSYYNVDNLLSAYLSMTQIGVRPITFLDSVIVLVSYTLVFTVGSAVFIKHKQFNN